MDNINSFDAETEALQADVMRFLAIIAFSLLVIFIPLIQLSVPPPDKTADKTRDKGVKPETVVIEKTGSKMHQKEEVKPSVASESKTKIEVKPEAKTKTETETETVVMKKPIVLEKPKRPIEAGQSLPSAEKKFRKLTFAGEAFNILLKQGKIKAYVILLQDNLSFESRFEKGRYLFIKQKPLTKTLYKLRASTLPVEMVSEFEQTFPALATEKREFYFEPSETIANAISAIQQSDQYGTFIITAGEEIRHEE